MAKLSHDLIESCPDCWAICSAHDKLYHEDEYCAAAVGVSFFVDLVVVMWETTMIMMITM